MEITGKMKADLVKKSNVANDSHDGRKCLVDVDIKFNREQAKKRVGETFERMAFSYMNGGAEEKHIVASIKPGKSIVFQLHEVEIEGHGLTVQPRLLTVYPIDGEEKVLARFRVGVDVSKRNLLTWLDDNVGKSIGIKFKPSQMPLPGTQPEA